MKAKLLKLDLPEKLVDEILNIFDNYEKTLKRYSKPAGSKAFQNNIMEVESLSKMLLLRLNKLSVFEIQLLNRLCRPKVFDFKTGLIFLNTSAKEAKKKTINFTRKEPFIRMLATELLAVLESHGYKVKIYRGNIFIKVLDVLLDVNKDDIKGDKSFNILRDILKA